MEVRVQILILVHALLHGLVDNVRYLCVHPVVVMASVFHQMFVLVIAVGPVQLVQPPFAHLDAPMEVIVLAQIAATASVDGLVPHVSQLLAHQAA